MKFTNKNAFEIALTLSECEEIGLLGYVIAKNRRLIANELTDYCVFRDELLSIYGTDIGNGQVKFDKESCRKFEEEISVVDAIEIDIPVLTVTEDIFTGGTLNSKQMFTLDWMVCRPDNKETKDNT